MQFNVAQLLKEPIGSERAYTLTGETLALEPGQTIPVGGYIRVTRTDKGVWVHATIDATVSGQCSRCLKSITQAISFELDEEYLQKLDLLTGAPVHSDDSEPDTFKLDARHTLDLREALRQYVITNTPMSPICKPTCKGLCPQCGADLNNGSCACSEDRQDPRWAALRQMLPSTRTTRKAKVR